MTSFYRKSLSFVFSLLCISIAVAASPSLSSGQVSAQPPLIDRELFIGDDADISGAQISPDGKFIAFVKPFQGTRNVWVKRTEEPFETAKPITADKTRPIAQYFWSRDGRYILFAQDKDGDENYNVYAVNPADSPAAGQDVPSARNLTDAKGIQAAIYAVPRSEPDAIYVGLNDRDKAWHDLYKVRISTGERTAVRQNSERITSWVFDLKDQLRLATRSAENGDTEVLTVSDKGFAKVYSCNVFETCGPLQYHKDGQRVYFLTNKGATLDLVQLVLFNPTTGKEELVESDPLKRVDFGNASFSEVTDELIATSYNDDRNRVYWKDRSFEADNELLEKKLPGKEVSFSDSTKDERLWLITAFSDTEPGERYLFDRQTKKVTLQYRVREKLPREAMAEMKAVRYKSSDGLEIPAYLTLPKGLAPKNLPAIVMPHGGPWFRDSWGYNGFAQFLANRGYAVLLPNFRASTGYGKKFLDAGNKEWGQKMQDDVTWGAKYLIAEGIADPKRIGIMGASYGGYAALAGVTFTPDMYAAGVSVVGPSNLITLLESIPPYWEQIRKLFYERMGDPNTPEGKAQLLRQSPLTHAHKIKTPLLVVQGANDPRVSKRESDQIVIALRDRGFPVEYLVAPDEGHGFARPVNNTAMIATMEKFLAKHLGGRFQESTTPEGATRLKEITVDVKTVTLPKKMDAVAGAAVKPSADLKAGKANYKGAIVMGGQSIPLTITTEVKESDNSWIVTDTSNIGQGGIVDEVTMEKTSLLPTHRSIKQGPVSIELDFKDSKVSGTMNMNGQTQPIALDAGGVIFADGAGAYDVMGALPLAEGYSTAFRNLDVQKQKVEMKQLKVLGSESVTVPAGTFEAFKVEVTSADNDVDKTTVWIAKDTRRVLKISAVLAALNGGTLTSELMP